MKEHKQEPQNNLLTTLDEWNLPKLVAQTLDESGIACIIQIFPYRERAESLLEMRGEWIQDIWQIVIREIPCVLGHRLLWCELLFLIPTTDLENVQETFSQILRSRVAPQLESRCTLALIKGDSQTKLKMIDRIGMETGKWDLPGYKTIFRHKLLNGKVMLE